MNNKTFQNKEPFVDDSFPPIPKSLYFDTNKPTKHAVQWLRPQEISVSPGEARIPWQVFRTPLPSDITQGILGNCWCVSLGIFVGNFPVKFMFVFFLEEVNIIDISFPLILMFIFLAHVCTREVVM